MRDPLLFDALVESFHRRTWDAAYYLNLCERVGGRVLELGVGTGRLFGGLLAAGHDAWGIENNEAMLGRAQERAQQQFGPAAVHRLSHGDARDFALDQHFDLVLASYNFLALVPPSDLPRVSDAVVRHLNRGGQFAFDLIVAEAAPWARMSKARRSTTDLLVGGVSVAYEVTARFDPQTRIHQLDEQAVFPDGRTVSERLCLYQWRVEQLVAELERLGWTHARPPTDQLGAPYAPRARIYCGLMQRRAV